MKNKLTRVVITISAILISIVVVLIFTFLGDKSKGPLEDFFSTTSSTVSDIENRLFMEGREEKRSESLKWFDPYRKNARRLSNPDTIFLGVYDNRTHDSYEQIIELEETINTVLPIIHLYRAWGSKAEQEFPSLHVKAILELGSLPIITWEPWLSDFDFEEHPELPEGSKRDKNGLLAISNGDYDFYIDDWIKEIKNMGALMLLRFGHEMNDPYRYPWGPQNNDPQAFIKAWCHIVDRFRVNEAHNVLWVWAPHPAYENFNAYYPGDDYVDWIGVGTLNYGTVAVWSQWWTFKEIFDDFYKIIELHQKPIILTEFACLPIGGQRHQWFGKALSNLPVEYPLIKAIVFFHSTDDNTTTYKSLDWSFTDDSLSVRAISQALDNWAAISKSVTLPE